MKQGGGELWGSIVRSSLCPLLCPAGLAALRSAQPRRTTGAVAVFPARPPFPDTLSSRTSWSSAEASAGEREGLDPGGELAARLAPLTTPGEFSLLPWPPPLKWSPTAEGGCTRAWGFDIGCILLRSPLQP